MDLSVSNVDTTLLNVLCSVSITIGTRAKAIESIDSHIKHALLVSPCLGCGSARQTIHYVATFEVFSTLALPGKGWFNPSPNRLVTTEDKWHGKLQCDSCDPHSRIHKIC